LKLSVMVSLEDSVLVYGTWGRVGVYHILNKLHRAGVSRVYWRSRGNGQADYPSRLTETKLTIYPDEIENDMRSLIKGSEDWINEAVNFDEFDHFKCARERCAELGMEFVVWEETRGEDHGHQQYSQFVKRYPQFLSVTRDGRRAWSELGWSFPEVMERRVGFFREVIGYEPDGVYFDFVKSGDDVVGRLDRDGYWNMGYEKPMVEGFREKTGRDPFSISNRDREWLQYQSDYVTEYLRRCKAIRDTFFPDVELGAFAVQPKYSASHLGKEADQALAFYPDDPLGNLEDHDTWIREKLVSRYVIGHTCRGEFDVLETVPHQIAMAKERLGSPVPFALEVETYSNREAVAGDWLDKLIAIAGKENIGELILREATPMWPHTNMWRALGERFNAQSQAPGKGTDTLERR